MRGDVKTTATVKFTKKEAEWLIDMLNTTANKATYDASKETSVEKSTLILEVKFQANSLKDKIQSELYS